MLVIRMQRTGRKGHAMFRVVVQDSRRTPTSGKIVAQLGSYNPHDKNLSINQEKAQFYLDHGAQPSERVARLLKAEGVKLPAWVQLSANKERTVRNADKRRSTRPDEPEAEEVAAAEPEAASEEAAVEAPAESEAPVEESVAADEPAETEAPAEATEVAKEEVAEAEKPAKEAAAEEKAEETASEDAAESKKAA